MDDRWLKGGAPFGLILCITFAVACGGGGSSGGGDSNKMTLANVEYWAYVSERLHT